ncbi:MFS multidrug transporter [Zalerion maritima]|uniref:MFS multidrug transporter n=1 Tax=Zalerion maritima TaxID=339359 RepID=A0AAD5RTG8_9PEZI|nr:MFS multidrug transporter [Zalerion maritima]
MVSDFGITEDKTKISFYAGMVTSAFTFAEFSTGVVWGRLSDKIGRKPVLLMGLAGTALSVLVFGFAPSLPVALVARALGGLLNGNIGVLQTTVAELVTVKEHQSRAYTIMPLVWCIGSIIGPMIGGTLAKPCDNFPHIFSESSIFHTYPYLLPNLFSASAVAFGVVIGVLFLEETHEDLKMRHDPGLAFGRRIITWINGWIPASSPSNEIAKLGEYEAERAALLDSNDDHLPRYCSSNSPRVSRSPASSTDELNIPESVDEELGQCEKQSVKPKIFTAAIVLNIISYGILAFHTMTFDSLLPVFLSTDRQKRESEYQLPFKFADGFGMSTTDIGVIMSVQGGYSLISNTFIFPFVVDRVGALNLFRYLAMSYFLLYFITPYLVLLPESLEMVGIYLIVIWKCTFSTMAYPSNALLLTNSALSTKTLGTINGVAASTASLCRAFGPTISGALYAIGLKQGYSGFVWWFSSLVTLIGAFISLRIPEPRGRMDIETDENEEQIDDGDDQAALFLETENRPRAC